MVSRNTRRSAATYDGQIMMGTHIEHLEHRRLFAAAPVVQLDGGVLRISGTDAADDIAIEAGRVQFKAHVNGQVHTFDTDAVRFIRIFGKAGDDSIIVSPRVHIRCSIEGNDGDDRIGGSARNDTILGGRGDDTLAGNKGNDYIDAGADDDRIDDPFGVNVIHGGAGYDRVVSVQPFLGSGVESPHVDDMSIVAYGSQLERENGRLILTHFGMLPQISDADKQSGPTLRDDGHYEVTTTTTIYGIGAALLGGFSHRWDITDQAASGIILTYKSADVASTFPGPKRYDVVYSLPFLLPA